MALTGTAAAVLALTPLPGMGFWSKASSSDKLASVSNVIADSAASLQDSELAPPVIHLGDVTLSATPRVAPLLANVLPNRVQRRVDPKAHSREFVDYQSADTQLPSRVRTLKALQNRYQGFVDAGGWGVIPAGPDVLPGERDHRIYAVRKRLAMTDDLDSARGLAFVDDTLVAALARFQQRVNLPPSGALDSATLAALNVSAERRLMSISLSLSRALALPQDPDQDYVLVNIAGFDAQYMRGDRTLWSGRTMVGKDATRTPQLVSAIDRVVFNPTWIVPNGIATRSVLPAIIKDPNYLDRKNMRVFNMAWQAVDPKTVNWKSVYASRKRDIYIRQDAGEDNALGKVKFLFPNKHSVFLHDTPSKHLFDTDTRAYSNGCVRLENPMALASAMLDAQGLDGGAMSAEAESNYKPEVIHLERPVPVHSVYLTAEMGAGGQAIFHADIYGENTEQAYASL